MQIIIDAEDYTGTCTLDEFLAANDLDEGEPEIIEAALTGAGEYHGGGGAAAEYFLRTATYEEALAIDAEGRPVEPVYFYEHSDGDVFAAHAIAPSELEA